MKISIALVALSFFHTRPLCGAPKDTKTGDTSAGRALSQDGSFYGDIFILQANKYPQNFSQGSFSKCLGKHIIMDHYHGEFIIHPLAMRSQANKVDSMETHFLIILSLHHSDTAPKIISEEKKLYHVSYDENCECSQLVCVHVTSFIWLFYSKNRSPPQVAVETVGE